MKTVVLIACLAGFSMVGRSQELNCQVNIVTDASLEVTSVELEIIEQLKGVIYEFMNNTQWTKDKFTVEERINCNLQIQISEIPQPGTYSGAVQVQSSRPAFNSSYNTTVFNFQDEDLVFGFSRNAVLAYAPNQYRDNITSILAFYAYYIIAMDYDSFSNKGGTKYFNEAQQIVTNAQSSGAPGWKSNERGKNNRYWLVDNALHQLFSPLRECSYAYHRKGLDVIYDDKVAGRKAVFTALNKLLKVVSTRPNSLNVTNFIRAKTIELVNLYTDADAKEKNQVVNLLKRLDPTNSSKYQEILE
ncbi:DUF4835 family protein [Crocinitomicaceae bacterium]|nr:DUF4835 family protein [Crocinitomicaceae bacterium]MDC0100536.1 DUF4835 family protein [Crocinitomicaceae bacterium]MDC1282669.1 DUF4835 family protein [Crocinitomicaceae bacterium]MDC1384582.1 DUF4835 family protein [Crocinitomicaceae bacterium]|tara:strand:+ start:350 stop:1255 length:906 start_codon:yes stop_codon:yes gene_type:complete